MSSIKLHTALNEATSYIEARLGGRRPALGLVLGSGLGGFADTLEDPVVIDYSRIPHFAQSTVIGHEGRFVVGAKAGVMCMAMQGRLHPYEGYSAADVAFPVRAMILLGADTLILTNAVGCLHEDWPPGSLMAITDHLNLTGQNPLTGANDDHIGPRFPDMTDAYAPELRTLARRAAARVDMTLREGVYAAFAGPSYETPAEIRMVRALGGDVVGMSTVYEVIAARHMGARVLGISCVTNPAAGISEHPLNHEEVTTAAGNARAQFQALLEAVIEDLCPTIGIDAGQDSDEVLV